MAGSLSLLADVGSTVGARAMPQFPRVVACAAAALQTRAPGKHAFAPSTRRAAAFLLASLLDTCDASDVVPLEAPLRAMRAPLAHAAGGERDASTRIHAKRALARLDAVSKAFFFPR